MEPRFWKDTTKKNQWHPANCDRSHANWIGPLIKICSRYTYFSKNVKPVHLFRHFFNMYPYSFWKFCHPVRLLERSEFAFRHNARGWIERSLLMPCLLFIEVTNALWLFRALSNVSGLSHKNGFSNALVLGAPTPRNLAPLPRPWDAFSVPKDLSYLIRHYSIQIQIQIPMERIRERYPIKIPAYKPSEKFLLEFGMHKCARDFLGGGGL